GPITGSAEKRTPAGRNRQPPSSLRTISSSGSRGARQRPRKGSRVRRPVAEGLPRAGSSTSRGRPKNSESVELSKPRFVRLHRSEDRLALGKGGRVVARRRRAVERAVKREDLAANALEGAVSPPERVEKLGVGGDRGAVDQGTRRLVIEAPDVLELRLHFVSGRSDLLRERLLGRDAFAKGAVVDIEPAK